jgi:predicted nucleotidyltransferase
LARRKRKYTVSSVKTYRKKLKEFKRRHDDGRPFPTGRTITVVKTRPVYHQPKFEPHAGAKPATSHGHMDVAEQVAQDLAGLYEDFYVMGSTAVGDARPPPFPSDVDIVLTLKPDISLEEFEDKISELGGFKLQHLGTTHYEIPHRYQYKVDITLTPKGRVESLRPSRPYLKLIPETIEQPTPITTSEPESEPESESASESEPAPAPAPAPTSASMSEFESRTGSETEFGIGGG